MINSLYPIFQHWSERGSVYDRATERNLTRREI